MSVFCIGNIDIRDFEKYRNSGYLENAARTITEYGGRYRVPEDRQKSSKVSLYFIDSWSSNFLPWNHSKVGIPPMLMPPGKKSDRNFLKPIFLLWKV